MKRPIILHYGLRKTITVGGVTRDMHEMTKQEFHDIRRFLRREIAAQQTPKKRRIRK